MVLCPLADHASRVEICLVILGAELLRLKNRFYILDVIRAGINSVAFILPLGFVL